LFEKKNQLQKEIFMKKSLILVVGILLALSMVLGACQSAPAKPEEPQPPRRQKLAIQPNQSRS